MPLRIAGAHKGIAGALDSTPLRLQAWRVEGRDTEALAREAIERLVDYEEWFIREVEKGLTQMEQGNVLTHEEVGARIERRLTELLENAPGRAAGLVREIYKRAIESPAKPHNGSLSVLAQE